MARPRPRPTRILTKRGLVLRALENYGLPHSLRMTIGTEEANRLVVDGLRDFMARQMSTTPLIPARRADRLRPDRRLDRARRAAAGPGRRDRHHRALGEDARAGAGARHRRPRRGDQCRSGEGADLVILCIPGRRLRARWRRRSRRISSRARSSPTSARSRARSSRDMAPHLPTGVHFVPAHPVAGTEHSGPDSGFAELFINRWCILTPPEGTDAGGDRTAARVLGGDRRQGRDHDAGSS